MHFCILQRALLSSCHPSARRRLKWHARMSSQRAHDPHLPPLAGWRKSVERELRAGSGTAAALRCPILTCTARKALAARVRPWRRSNERPRNEFVISRGRQGRGSFSRLSFPDTRVTRGSKEDPMTGRARLAARLVGRPPASHGTYEDTGRRVVAV